MACVPNANKNSKFVKKIYQVYLTSPKFKYLLNFNNLKKAFKTVKLVF